MKQKECIGFDSIASLESVLDEFKTRKLFLVVEEVSYSASGAQEYLDTIAGRYDIEFFSDFEPNPKAEDVACGIELFNKFKPDVVIAIGGGSVIDMAKMINFFATNVIEPVEYVKTDAKKIIRGKPLIAVPTTSGTGSEATHFAVLYINQMKYSIADEVILPDIAIVDPALTMSLPPKITAATGMDALCQAIESYWCINSTDESKIYSKEAMLLSINNLDGAVNSPDKTSRDAMAISAHLAGKAINITKTTAAHAVSYPITSYFGIPHGHAVALTLPGFLLYNSKVTDEDVLDKRGSAYVRKNIAEITGILGYDSPENAGNAFYELMSKIGLQTRLADLNIKMDHDVDIIVENGFNPQRVKNNPRALTEQALRTILNSIR